MIRKTNPKTSKSCHVTLRVNTAHYVMDISQNASKSLEIEVSPNMAA